MLYQLSYTPTPPALTATRKWRKTHVYAAARLLPSPSIVFTAEPETGREKI